MLGEEGEGTGVCLISFGRFADENEEMVRALLFERFPLCLSGDFCMNVFDHILVQKLQKIRRRKVPSKAWRKAKNFLQF
jgi:hypothetical protein